MKLVPSTNGFRSRTLGGLRSILGDPLYRGSLNLFLNTGILAVLGVAFWTVATHSYPASTVGLFAALTSGVGLLSTVATLGFQNTITRHVASAENPRALVSAVVVVIVGVGAALCLLAILLLGPHLPSELHLRQRGSMVVLLTALVVVSAIGTVFSAGLVAIRASHSVVIANSAGNIVKLVAIVLLAAFRSSGILLSFSLGLFIGTFAAGLALFRRLKGTGLSVRSFGVLRSHLPITVGNHLATTMGILPATVVPLVVLAIGGPVETAHFGIVFTVVSFLTVIPSTLAGVLFAEASRPGTSLRRQLRKALRGTYVLLLPALAVLIVAGPFALRIFGASYADAGAGCLRVLALSSLPMAGNYMVDSLLIARDRIIAYVFMNGANAALVIGGVAFLLPHGLTAAAAGWGLGQVLSLLLGLIVVTTGRTERHHRSIEPAMSSNQADRYVQEARWRDNYTVPFNQDTDADAVDDSTIILPTLWGTAMVVFNRDTNADAVDDSTTILPTLWGAPMVVFNRDTDAGDQTTVFDRVTDAGDQTTVFDRVTDAGDQTTVFDRVTDAGDQTTVFDRVTDAGDQTTVFDRVTDAGDQTTVFDRVTDADAVDDPTIIPPPLWGAASEQVVVGDIPRQALGFQPRAYLLQALDRAGAGASVLHAPGGIQGVGKTQIAAAYARAKLAEGWRLVAWIHAGDTESVLAGLAEVADSAGIPSGGRERGAAEVGHALRQCLEADGQGCLIVFDDAPDPDVLRPFVPSAGAAQVLITSGRRSLTNLGADVLVDVFTAEEALTFMAAQTGIADDSGAAAVAAELRHVPLALAQAAAVIGRQDLTFAAYLEGLQALPAEDYLAREQGQPYPHGMAEAVLLSLEAVRSGDDGGTSSAVMELMAVLSSTGVRRDLLYAAGQAGVLSGRRRRSRIVAPMVDRALARLTKHSLLNCSLDGQTIITHPLVARVLRDELVRQGRLTAVYWAAAYVLDTRTGTLESSQNAAAVRHLLRQVTELQKTAAQVGSDSDGELARMLLSLRFSLLYHLDGLGDSASQAVAVGELVVRDSERLLGSDHPDTLGSRNNLAAAYQAAGRVDEAISLFEQILAARERLLGPDHPDTLGSRNNLAAADQAAGRVDEAISLFEQILAARERLLGPDHLSTANSRSNLASAYRRRARLGGDLAMRADLWRPRSASRG